MSDKQLFKKYLNGRITFDSMIKEYSKRFIVIHTASRKKWRRHK